MKTTVSISLLTLIVFLGLSPDIARAQDSSAPTLFHACYVPATGIVYRIKGAGLADECRSPRHVEFTWTDGLPDHDHGNLEGLSDDDHPEYVREGEVAGGDLGKTYPDPIVVGLRGNALSDAAPADGQILGWDGTAGEWTPMAAGGDIESVVAGAGLTGGGSAGEITLSHADVSTQSSVDNSGGRVVQDVNLDTFGHMTGVTSVDLSDFFVNVSETAGGDLGGNYPNPGVVGLQGNAVSDVTPADRELLGWDGTAGEWTPMTAPSGVTDHGDLTGLGNDDHGQYILVDGVRDATDGFAVTGTLGTGVIPAEGAGTRIMWYPGKAAFRVGRVTIAQWDDTNIGLRSTAMGLNTTASGSSSTALGSSTTASGPAATAIGVSTTASALGAMAMGRGARASGRTSTAMGFATLASGVRSTAMGGNTTASGERATAMGSGTEASGFISTAMGSHTTAQARSSVVIGRSNLIEGNPDSWVDDDPLFVAGNGASLSAPSNALTLRKNGDLTIAGTLTESSDARFKTGIEPLGTALEGLLSIRPVRFRFRDGTGHPTDAQIGLIAQEVRDVFPELVTADSQGHLSLAYPKLTAVLLGGFQEQQAQIREQRTRIEARDELLEDLQRQTERLEARNERMAERLERLEEALQQLRSRAALRPKR